MLLAQMATQSAHLDFSDASRAMIARSAPPPEKALELVSDAEFISREEGGACSPPKSLLNPSVAEAVQFAESIGYPLMLKRDGSAGGLGVTKCHDKRQLLAAMQSLSPKLGFVLQEFMPGPVYGVAVSGVAGRVAAAFAFEKHLTLGPHGVATVLKYEPRQDIRDHACALYERYGLNGFCGIDYIADANGGAHLLEINRCIVPKSHFSGAFGVDLVEAMLCVLRERPVPEAKAPPHEYVALFPLEWRRDPQSHFLTDAHHDVPWEDPAVLTAMIQDAAKPRSVSDRPPA